MDEPPGRLPAASLPSSEATSTRSPSISPDSRDWPQRSLAYQFLPFRGIYTDIRNRLPFYLSDWTEGFKPSNFQRVAGATVRIFFLNIFPMLAYIIDMNVRTGGSYGVNEGILASAIAALTFAVFSVQPLTIVGDVGIIYIQKGIELLVYEFDGGRGQAGWFSVVVAILFALSAYFVERAGTLSFGPFWLRKFIVDYAFAAVIIFYTGFVHIPGYIKDSDIQYLPITKAFAPTLDRDWVVPFWNLPVKWVFVALPFGCLNNVSSLMAQSRGFPVKRPAGFHWDFFLLGLTTFVSGIIGLPAPNGLVPQAPVHTEALCETKVVPEETEVSEGGFYEGDMKGLKRERSDREMGGGGMKIVRTRLVEQRVSHFAMGASFSSSAGAPSRGAG
ncbi:SPOSA6832_00032, partial [Sporobolomyces salmonicolor]